MSGQDASLGLLALAVPSWQRCCG